MIGEFKTLDPVNKLVYTKKIMELMTQAQFSRVADVSRPAITKAVKRGEVVLEPNGKVDAENPKNLFYIRKKKVRPGYKTPDVSRLTSGDQPDLFDPAQKTVEDTRYKKAQADLKSLEYAEKLGVIIDISALNQKFGAFYDFLLNDLIYMPESIADILWMKARASETPERAIEDELKVQIGDIIQKAKRAAESVRPPVTGAQYIMTAPEEGAPAAEGPAPDQEAPDLENGDQEAGKPASSEQEANHEP